MENRTEYFTKNIYFRFNDEDKSIFMSDRNDLANETSSYNKAKRGYKKAKEMLLQAISMDDMSTMSQWIRVCDEKFKLKMHIYCAID